MKPAQRIVAMAGIVALVALAVYASIWAQTPDYATLFSSLSDQDAAAVVEQLKELKIPYRLVQGGAVIQVPQRQVYEARLEMAQQGLPKGGTVGFELFDGGELGNLGMTDFMQRINYQRALEGELARTVSSLEPVASARAHIVIPEPSLFSEEEQAPTASIVLQLKSGAKLTHEQVRAINHLVASSVEGLKPSNITLVDMQGNILATAGEGDNVPSFLQASSGQLEVQRAYERDLETRLQTMLDQALGPSRSVVRASVSFNWDQKQVNSETFAPRTDGAGVLRSEQSQEESYEGAGVLPGGAPGVDSNTVPTYPAGTDAEASRYTKSNTTRNYEVSKVVQTVTQAPGTLQRISVAVMLDESLAQDRVEQIQAMVAAAAGVDTSRGDAVVVQRVPFEATAALASDPTLADVERRTTIMNAAKLAGLLIALLVLLRFAQLTFRDLSRRLAGDYAPYVSVVESALPIPAEALQLPGAPAGAEDAPALAEALAQMPPPSQSPVTLLREQLIAIATRDPEVVADLVQSWLAEP